MTITAQILTLAGVVIGAITSLIVTMLNDRVRFRREQARHWNDQRLESYLEYLNAVKEMNRISRRIAAARGIGRRAPRLEIPDGLRLLAEAEARRANASEKVTLLGDASTVEAIRGLNREVWRLEWIARGLLSPDENTWERCNRSLIRASNLVHERIRKELGVPGDFLAREPGPPYEPTLPSSAG